MIFALLLEDRPSGASRREYRDRIMELLVQPSIMGDDEEPDPETWGATPEAIALQEEQADFWAGVTYGESS